MTLGRKMIRPERLAAMAAKSTAPADRSLTHLQEKSQNMSQTGNLFRCIYKIVLLFLIVL
jgi:hypothetical protein